MSRPIQVEIYTRPTRKNPSGLIAMREIYQRDLSRVKEWRIAPLDRPGVRVHRIVITLPEGA